MKNNYVLIDYENVQAIELDKIHGLNLNVWIFTGENQKKIPTDLVQNLLKVDPKPTLVVIDGNGKNALDFHIAFYLGELATKDPNGFFHIISKDTGFDPLISHLKQKKIFCARESSIDDIPLIKYGKTQSTSERIEIIKKKLPQARPRTMKSLKSSIQAIFLKALSEPDIDEIINEMNNTGLISIENEKPVFKF
jgi:hypothetical protein